MRSAPLTTIRSGINRLRTKGGARPDVLYDLLNGYVTESGTVKRRPGTERVATLDSATRGLCAFNGELHVFCHKQVEVPAGYVLNIVAHPDPPDPPYYGYGTQTDPYADGVPIRTIHFAEPFLGGLYIVAEFETDDVYHYWLQAGTEWQADTQYEVGDFVAPSVPNGIMYSASRFGDPYQIWQANESRYDGINDAYAQSIIEPTVYNGYYYVCVETKGPNPRSGTIEPDWPTFEGGIVFERTDTGLAETQPVTEAPPPPAGIAPTTPVTTSTTTTTDRYDLNRIVNELL